MTRLWQNFVLRLQCSINHSHIHVSGQLNAQHFPLALYLVANAVWCGAGSVQWVHRSFLFHRNSRRETSLTRAKTSRMKIMSEKRAKDFQVRCWFCVGSSLQATLFTSHVAISPMWWINTKLPILIGATFKSYLNVWMQLLRMPHLCAELRFYLWAFFVGIFRPVVCQHPSPMSFTQSRPHGCLILWNDYRNLLVSANKDREQQQSREERQSERGAQSEKRRNETT